MIAIRFHKDKHAMWHLRVMDAGDNNAREILRSGGLSPREAAGWLLRNVNKIATEVEEQLVELGLLTEVECEVSLRKRRKPLGQWSRRREQEAVTRCVAWPTRLP